MYSMSKAIKSKTFMFCFKNKCNLNSYTYMWNIIYGYDEGTSHVIMQYCKMSANKIATLYTY